MEKRVLDGFIVLKKPVNITSNKALQIVKHLFQAKKAGFVGTLDPFASGMLPICFGRATKCSDALHEYPKTYIATLSLGHATTTGDTEGEMIDPQAIPPFTQVEVESAMRPFIGSIQQTPPLFSALKKDGQPLYKLARKGIHVERMPRTVHIHALSLLALTPNSLQFSVQCSKGTYIRVLGEDLAKKLGTSGHLTQLYRQACAGFSEEDMLELSYLEGYRGRLSELDLFVRPIDML